MAFGGARKSAKTYDAPGLYEYAVGALGRRMRTVAELKRLLRQKKFAGTRDDAEAAIEAVVIKLKEQRYLNDTQYAALYSASRKDGRKLGRQRVATELKARGVHGDIIEKTMEEAYAGEDEEQLARQFLARKRIQPPQRPAVNRAAPRDQAMAARKQFDKESARVFRLLARAGFRTGTIINVLKKWKVEDEVLSALEEEQG